MPHAAFRGPARAPNVSLSEGVRGKDLSLRIVDARRDNSPASGEITPPKTLLHICQQNYKMKGEGISPALSV